ncbi:Hypothetical predicted protein [Olea europaea subsp. europaea]|uniref:Uncharacterized protein n=1 Tax=Olea europaea subsp. europaea TaxID=158383 RepID=A0A8S0S8M2_OLEEU|nr:Hypothetical predicted protein [Olea europaea subsp. europaea]
MGSHVVQVVDEVRKQFFRQLTELQIENHRMSVAIDAMKSEISLRKHDQQIEISLLKHDQQNKLNNIFHGRKNIVRDYEPLDKSTTSSFDLGVCFTQPTPIEPTKLKKVETYVASVIDDVLKDTEFAEKVVGPDNFVRYVNYYTLHVSASHSPYQINMQESPISAPSFGLPVKRAPRQAKALQSLYVHDGKQNKHSNIIVIFQHYNQSVDHADIGDF